MILLKMYHKNQKSTYLKYEVFGNVLDIAFKREHNTSREVRVPINLLLKFSKLMKKDRYATNHINHDGMKIEII